MSDIIQYIIQWLCYGTTEAAARVAYTADEQALAQYDIIIVPNGQLGTNIVLPDMSRPVIENPTKGKYIIRTDIIYNTFFFISRAEEVLNPHRDKHGRFLAEYSILGKNNRLQIPLLDEYARLLLKLLEAPLPNSGFEHIYLTHDIDSIAQYRHLRGALGGLYRGEKQQVFQALQDIHQDPLYTFPWLIEQDRQVPQAESIYFVKQTKGKGYDYPQYWLHGRDWKNLRQLLKDSGAQLGVHSSYYGLLPSKPISQWHRSHFLNCSLEQMQQVVEAGFTDDFTMGFADQAGFRLQTSRAVQWINPQTMQLTSLTMHPLIIMDCTLSNDDYMNLTEDEAYFLCERLISKVRMHNGDACLLWHNSNLGSHTYHASLYPKILQLLHG
ncbi:MAG: hypothetical protein U0L62_08820 [Paludibacteraceae bacterium]|nr:hypothetical protein [Paludibacteraceae bacterium]